MTPSLRKRYGREVNQLVMKAKCEQRMLYKRKQANDFCQGRKRDTRVLRRISATGPDKTTRVSVMKRYVVQHVPKQTILHAD